MGTHSAEYYKEWKLNNEALKGGGTIGSVEGNTKPQRSNPAKKFCFTWNNYPENAIKELLAPKFTMFEMDWIVGREIGDSGTPHLQGYFECKAKSC